MTMSCPRCRCPSCQVRNGRLPGGISGLCFMALVSLGGAASTTGILDWAARAGLGLTLTQVRTCLHGMARRDCPLITLAQAGRPGIGSPGGDWRLTQRGRELLFVNGRAPAPG
jgi:hypothetical protein